LKGLTENFCKHLILLVRPAEEKTEGFPQVKVVGPPAKDEEAEAARREEKEVVGLTFSRSAPLLQTYQANRGKQSQGLLK
jgi:hypothetical protein